LAQRFIWISPQFGQRNFVASPPGAIGLPQLVQVARVNVAAFSSIMLISAGGSVIAGPPYIFCVLPSQLYYRSSKPIFKRGYFWA
jgi:hypothetical protein